MALSSNNTGIEAFIGNTFDKIEKQPGQKQAIFVFILF